MIIMMIMQCCSTRVRDSDSSPTRELNLETCDLTRTRALGTRELRRGLDFFNAIIVICHYSIIWYVIRSAKRTVSGPLARRVGSATEVDRGLDSYE